MMKEKETDLLETLVERPKGFCVGNEHFFLYPVTLGKMLLIERLVKSLSINPENLKADPFAEALRLASAKTDECALIIAYHTLNTKADVLNSDLLIRRKTFFASNLDDEATASLLLICLSWDKTSEYMKQLGLDKEGKRLQKVLKVKESKNTYIFGGKSIYGSLIGNVCEKFGWTYDYVLWGISYVNLQLLLKDCVQTVYLTNEEAKRCHVTKEGMTINGNDPLMMKEYINSMDWK